MSPHRAYWVNWEVRVCVGRVYCSSTKLYSNVIATWSDYGKLNAITQTIMSCGKIHFDKDHFDKETNDLLKQQGNA